MMQQHNRTCRSSVPAVHGGFPPDVHSQVAFKDMHVPIRIVVLHGFQGQAERGDESEQVHDVVYRSCTLGFSWQAVPSGPEGQLKV
jgi:hypothetical protein